MTAELEQQLLAAVQEQTKVMKQLKKVLERPAAPLAVKRRLATEAEACELLGVKRARLFELTKQKRIIRVLDGLKARWDVDSIERHLEQQIAAQGGRRRGPGRPRKEDYEREAERMEKLKP